MQSKHKLMDKKKSVILNTLLIQCTSRDICVSFCGAPETQTKNASAECSKYAEKILKERYLTSTQGHSKYTLRYSTVSKTSLNPDL